jgi:hypothetical protein
MCVRVCKETVHTKDCITSCRCFPTIVQWANVLLLKFLGNTRNKRFDIKINVEIFQIQLVLALNVQWSSTKGKKSPLWQMAAIVI